MNILRVADEKTIPWFNVGETNPSTPIEEVEEINLSNQVDEIVLVQECDRIEACSTNGKIYHYNSNWDKGVVSHLREYAVACGMDLSRFKGADPSELQKVASSNDMVRTAQTAETRPSNQEAQSLKGVWQDPFHIDERSDTSYMDETNWQEVKSQNVLSEPSLNVGTVLALRGGENYFENSDVNPAPNQNSITNPDAIQTLAESEVMDNGERLRLQQQEKEARKAASHSEWEQSKIDEMSYNDIVPKGTVFPTESLNAQTGLNTPSSSMGVYAKFDPNSLPDKTAGEQLAAKNEAHKASIQRPKHEDDWQKPSQQNARSISSDFAESLAKALKK